MVIQTEDNLAVGHDSSLLEDEAAKKFLNSDHRSMAVIADDLAIKEENMRQAVRRIQLRNIKSHVQLTTLPQIV